MPKNSSILTILSNDLQSTNNVGDHKIKNNSLLSNQSSSYYDYDIEIPVEIPELPDELKVKI